MTIAELKTCLRIARTSTHRGTRTFAALQSVCIILGWITLLGVGILLALRFSGGPGVAAMPTWLRGVIMVLLAGTVGYGTNYVAIIMLFKPYSSTERHWVRYLTLGLWRQGLIPNRKDALADSIAKVVADRLLTPEKISTEIIKVVEQALDDPQVQKNIRYVIGPIIRDNIPHLVDRFTPEILSILRQGLSRTFRPERLLGFHDRVIEPLLQSPEVRGRIVDQVTTLLRANLPQVVQWLQEAAERYKSRGWVKRAAVWLAEKTKALDWEEVRSELHGIIDSPDSRRRMIEFAAQIGPKLRGVLSEANFQPIIERLKVDTSDFVSEQIQAFLKAELPEAANRLLDTPKFWQWLSGEGLSLMKPRIIHWLGQHGVEFIGRRFDVRGVIKRAVLEMEVAEVHQMLDEVSAEQLGAIQVLGFALGAVAGLILLLM